MVLLLVMAPLLVWDHPGVGAGADDCSSIYAKVGKPLQNNDPSAIELCRLGYVLSYNPETRVADWVMERITPESLTGPATRRSSRFRTDPELGGIAAPRLADYRGSGYDRGHLAPAGNMKWSQQAMDQSFYLANIAPQVGVGFNRGIWKKLEEKVRDLAARDATLVVITGPVYYDHTPMIGGGVIVPDAFYKIIYQIGSKTTWAVLMPNIEQETRELDGFAVTIDTIERLTGLDFFSALPAKDQHLLESRPQAF